ncbi:MULTISPECIES: hypothetical protein [Sphingobium]|uniref:hypothetical protein n=1 Tax=Sphingobium TaxID=165695 RepID=UPI0015EC2B7F|nr:MULTISPECIES: hypothetical protein [Sphingobium]MCW2363124.1 hypothetical protein [Sphingobium sp. B10D3B]MCW2400196.1 hypothetical protein [Sphingobium sp. B10D7B]MCW2407174.1 hypothetical protein [Sphingobium xanthum]
MTCQPDIEPPHHNAQLSLDSTLIEKALEYQLIGELIAKLLARGQRCEVLNAICDRDGYDVVIEAAGIVRHIQLKSRVQGGKNSKFDIATRLADKPSGCAILISWDRDTIRPTGFRYLGCAPGQPLDELGDKATTHSRYNRQRARGLRPAYRSVLIGRFDKTVTLDILVDQLFGPAPVPDSVDGLEAIA